LASFGCSHQQQRTGRMISQRAPADPKLSVKSKLARHFSIVRPGAMGDRLYLRRE
jgi:hypothetical protein